MAPTAKNTKSRAFGWLAAAVAALALPSVACGPITPVTPTWKNDIRPLLVSRCIRCHDDPGRADPVSKTIAPPAALYNFNYVDIPSPRPMGIQLLIDKGVKSVDGTRVGTRMPPPPAEALEDWQIETLQGWTINPI